MQGSKLRQSHLLEYLPRSDLFKLEVLTKEFRILLETANDQLFFAIATKQDDTYW